MQDVPRTFPAPPDLWSILWAIERLTICTTCPSLWPSDFRLSAAQETPNGDQTRKEGQGCLRVAASLSKGHRASPSSILHTHPPPLFLSGGSMLILSCCSQPSGTALSFHIFSHLPTAFVCMSLKQLS